MHDGPKAWRLHVKNSPLKFATHESACKTVDKAHVYRLLGHESLSAHYVTSTCLLLIITCIQLTKTVAQIPLAACVSLRVTLVVCVAPCLFRHGGRRRSSSARVYKFRILCSGCASISVTTAGKTEVDMSTPVNAALATPLNTCRACRACRDERVAPCCRTSATQHVPTFPCAKMHGINVVSWRNKWNLGL